MLKIVFSNNEEVSIGKNDIIQAWVTDNKEKQPFYAHDIFSGTLSNSKIATRDSKVGLQGLLGQAEWISINHGPLYKTSSIIKIID
ncbi:hypothetical protein FD18_GL001245 [Lactobacillus taiwanensis DSM 21401]|uniref:hypothetical protein n=1 Tax=Lactobacillus taiwanensis TaxID=508451 RepID=UPI0006EEB73A|nr:hypothetical protein [Lactobacillus taiwanensis]KRM98281.1 hypothetical protein FD18_GL001245 [Lactobacillus taiwanensis DSM 21401]